MRFLTFAFLLAPIFGQESAQRIELQTPEQKQAEAALDAEKRLLTEGATTDFNVRQAQRKFDRTMQEDKVDIKAQSIERTGNLWRLHGAVEIRISDVIVRADDADYHEDTGAIEPRGNVRVVPAE
jgi:lipopolysaccharide assembly outer membrane protein LptD (OstA)